MKIKNVETEKEVMLMSAMEASSVEQNQVIKEMYESNELQLENCFIMLDDDKVVARVILFANEHFGLYTLEDIQIEDAISFVKYVLKKSKCKKASMHLYSDKVNYQLVMNSLLSSGFKCAYEKESYVVKPQDHETKLTYQNGKQIKKEIFMNMIKAVFANHKDRGILSDLQEYGLEKTSQDLYNDGDVKKPEFYLAAFHHGEIVGFVFLKELAKHTAGIGYIGVLPEHRGNKYSSELLMIASKVAFEYGYKEIIADIDVENFAMRDNLLKAGYKKSCDEKVFIYQK